MRIHLICRGLPIVEIVSWDTKMNRFMVLVSLSMFVFVGDVEAQKGGVFLRSPADSQKRPTLL